MKVVYFHDSARLGGAERYLVDLCGGIAARGVEVHVASPSDALLALVQDELDDAVAIHILPPRPAFDSNLAGNVYRAGKPLAHLTKLLHRLQPDLLHINNGGYPGSHLARAAVLATRRARVMTVHAVPQDRKPRLRAVYAAMDQLVWRSLARVLCGTRATADALHSLRGAPPELLQVIPYGVRPPESSMDSTNRLRRVFAPEGELVAGMVVAPDPTSEVTFKGHDVLLDALAATRRTDIRAVFVGHDPGPAFRARAEALSIADRIVLLGRVAEIAPYMAAFDALVVPSTRYESLPLVTLEAMASGTPVLASHLSGIPEAVVEGESGYTFPPGDSRALAELLDMCAAKRASLERLGDRASRVFQRRFSLEAMIDAVLAVYGEVSQVERRRGR